jgi:hypothetical protein
MDSIILKTLAKESIYLSKRMEAALIDYVSSKGGYIDTTDDHSDSIWAFVFDEIDEHYVEKQVIAVKVENNNLLIKLDYPLSTEEDAWYNVTGGLCLINATLYNLCECIWEYN